MLVSHRQIPVDGDSSTLSRLLNTSVSQTEELEALRGALRECRTRLYRGALESTRRIMALSHTVSCLEARNRSQLNRIRELEAEVDRNRSSGIADVPGEGNEAHCIWTLKKNLLDAHAEYALVVEERNRLAAKCAELCIRLSD